MSPEDAARLREALRDVEEILSRNTDLSQLKNMDDVEMETRRRIQEYVAPELMSFLVPRVVGERVPSHPKRRRWRYLKTTLGQVRLSSGHADILGVGGQRQFSPLVEKFALVAAARVSFEQASLDLAYLCGIRISDSTLQRLVQGAAIPTAAPEVARRTVTVENASIDGGKVRLATGTNEPGTKWCDYKAITVNGGLPDQERHACLHDNQGLAQRVRGRPGVEWATILGDGHAGIWNLAAILRPEDSPGLEILDWYHLNENVHKYRWSKARLKRISDLLWQGEVEQVLTEEIPDAGHCLHEYLVAHRTRIVNYAQRQKAGQIIGSGAVESTIKQIDARLQLPGAWWEPRNVNQILNLRNAYLNRWLYSVC